MHLGEVERQPVHGKATPEEAQSLVDDGVPLIASSIAGSARRQVN